jgi:hypothetical protein
MRVLDFGGIPTSLGEIIHFKFYLDKVKNQYDQIRLGFATGLWDDCLHTNAPDWQHKKILWEKYLSDIGQLFFSEPPYVLEAPTKWGGSTDVLVRELGINPQKVEMGHLLCKGESLNLGNDYIVITTKIRAVKPDFFYNSSNELWDVLRQISKKYKIVILGERKVEVRKEYETNHAQGWEPIPFGIYDDIISNLPGDCLIDRTVPALGETVSDLATIQQDCLIMKEAKFVVTLGIGGNFCLATSVSDMAIGFRGDNNPFADAIFNREYSNAIISKDWNRFIAAIKVYV